MSDSSNSTLAETVLPKQPDAAHQPRQYHTAAGTLEREGEMAERLVSDFGGDAPTSIISHGPLATRTRSRRQPTQKYTNEFPELHLTDSAFSAAHGSMRAMSRSMSAYGTPTTPVGESDEDSLDKPDPHKVAWYENDPENPQNWSYSYKWIITAICSLLTVNVTFASTAPSSATLAIAQDLNTTVEISVLATSLFLFGYCTGPLLWAPLSELFGRRPVFIITMAIYTLFQIGDALAQNITTVVVIRFLAGTFAAAPLTNAGGVIADTWDPVGRGPAMSVFSASVFLGPVLGPIVGGFLTTSFLTWRWIFWIQMIFASVCLAVVIFFLPETYAPVLLAQRAKRMRKEEPELNKDVYSELERADFSFKGIITRTLARPFIMLFKEPILVLVTIYMSIVYALLYSLFSVFPLIWTALHGFSNGETGLVFIGVGLGTTVGAGINIWLGRGYKTLVPKWHGHPPPEQRLMGAMLAGPFLVIGCFFLGWTGYLASIPWYVPAIATVLLGVSFTLVFISFLTYLIEVYLMYAASALAANTIVRSALAGAFPLFTDQMFAKLGIQWACSLIGFIAILIAPIPILFYYYGAGLRAGSTFAPCLDLPMRERVEREEEEEKERLTGEKKQLTV